MINDRLTKEIMLDIEQTLPTCKGSKMAFNLRELFVTESMSADAIKPRDTFRKLESTLSLGFEDSTLFL